MLDEEENEKKFSRRKSTQGRKDRNLSKHYKPGFRKKVQTGNVSIESGAKEQKGR
jgi:hypothetical protein